MKLKKLFIIVGFIISLLPIVKARAEFVKRIDIYATENILLSTAPYSKINSYFLENVAHDFSDLNLDPKTITKIKIYLTVPTEDYLTDDINYEYVNSAIQEIAGVINAAFAKNISIDKKIEFIPDDNHMISKHTNTKLYTTGIINMVYIISRVTNKKLFYIIPEEVFKIGTNSIRNHAVQLKHEIYKKETPGAIVMPEIQFA